VAGPLTWLAALRLTLCVAIAEVVALMVPLERSYWITLTVGIVLSRTSGPSSAAPCCGGSARSSASDRRRCAGAWRARLVLVLLIAVFAGGVAVGKVRNYAILSAFMTPLIILQMDLSNNGNWSVVLARLIDTVLGCAIVLVFGYLLWPGSRRPQVGGRLADGLDTVAKYVRTRWWRYRARRGWLAHVPGAAPTGRWPTCGRRFQQVVVEPSANGRQAVAWWPVIAGLERVADAVTEVGVTIGRGVPPPDPATSSSSRTRSASSPPPYASSVEPRSMPFAGQRAAGGGRRPGGVGLRRRPRA